MRERSLAVRDLADIAAHASCSYVRSMADDTVPTALPAPRGGLRSCGTCGAVYRTDFARCPNDGDALAVSAVDPLIGTVLGSHYKIDALVGEGAMGRVYRAQHTRLEAKRFAVKVLLGDLAVSAAMRMRFAREAEATSRLDHPNIVGVHDFGRSPSGLLYIVMELVEGETLGAVMRRGPMAPARVLRLVRQLCRGLAHAHARGVIHRDLKPDNILLTSPGAPNEAVRISDFGLAVTRDDDARLTTSGVVCTPAYAAPEQLLGRAVDARADLYALGATMFEMLTGGIPVFGGDVQEVTARKLANEPRSPLVLAPATPRALARVIDRLLEHDPDRRPATALDVLGALDAGALDATQPVPLPKRRRHALVAICGAAVLAVSAAAAMPDSVATAMPAMSASLTHAAPLRVRSVAHELQPAAPRAVGGRAALAAPAGPVRPLALAPPAEVPAPRPPAVHHALQLVRLDVEGSLPHSMVERAVARVLPAVRGCRTAGSASFTIDDSRRATAIRAASPCVAEALGRVRTEEAPDVGDVSVSLQLR